MERWVDFHDLQGWQEQLRGHAHWAITQHAQNENTAFHLHQHSHEESKWKSSWKEMLFVSNQGTREKLKELLHLYLAW